MAQPTAAGVGAVSFAPRAGPFLAFLLFLLLPSVPEGLQGLIFQVRFRRDQQGVLQQLPLPLLPQPTASAAQGPAQAFPEGPKSAGLVSPQQVQSSLHQFQPGLFGIGRRRGSHSAGPLGPIGGAGKVFPPQLL
jgi:hypothetical protein